MANTLKKLDSVIIAATRSTLNTAIRKVNTQTIRKVASVYNIPQKALRSKSKREKFKNRFKIQLASNKSLQASIKRLSHRLPLDRFFIGSLEKGLVRKPRARNKATSKPVRVRIKKKSRREVAGAFVGTGKQSRVVTVFRRKTPRDRAIKRLYTSSVTQMFEREAPRVFKKVAQEEVPKLMKSKTQFFLEKKFGRTFLNSIK